ncbi:signal recognition particle, SRP14 subunit [Aspergillus pseudoustus]|uniref:Signal recognition particle subunit SRP14 n=1 Tax=Aspergillus pseudoustus TaxID=1810923 RepID=A0ABR4KB20_9EURO
MSKPLGHEEFFASLTTLLTSTSQKTRGSVYLTQKPLLPTSTDQTSTTISPPSILIRATDGNTNAPNPKSASEDKNIKKKSKESKAKLSTVVQPDELETFYAKYAEVCKAGMTGLKKRDRKQKKAKGKGGAGKVSKA